MSYTVLARRYRSGRFEDIVGQAAIAKTLQNAIENDRVAHAYLFTGTRGVGKTTTARVLAKSLNCLAFDQPTSHPCCKCDSCIAVNEGEDIDVLEIDGASNTGVDHIRDLRQNAIYRPARSRFKIYIIDEVHMLSVSAFNALLKTLEEPPEHVKFIFATTEPQKIPATILSRCQRFDFRNIQMEEILKHLEEILAAEGMKAEDGFLRRIARLARGSMRDGLSLLDQAMSLGGQEGEPLQTELLDVLLGRPRSETIFSLAESIGQADVKATLQAVYQALSEGLAPEQLSDGLQEHFRDLLVLKNCGPDSELIDVFDPQVREKMVVQAKMFTDEILVYNITVLEELRRSLRAGSTSQALLEAAMVRLSRAGQFQDIRALLEQMNQLKKERPVRFATPPTGTHTPPDRATTKPVENKPSPSPEKTPSSGFTPPANISLDWLQNQWPAILQAFAQKGKAHLANYIQTAHPADWSEGKLILNFQPGQKGVYELLQSQKQLLREIQEALSGILTVHVQLVPAMGGTGPAPGSTGKNDLFSERNSHQIEPTPLKKKMPPGAKPSQDEINAAMSEPHIRQVQNILGGKLRHIERRIEHDENE